MMGSKGIAVTSILILVLLIAVATAGGYALVQGVNLLILIIQNATSFIGLMLVGVGAAFLFLKAKTKEDRWIGIIMIAAGAVIGIGGVTAEIIRALFANTIIMVFIIGLVILVYAKREGLLK